MTAAGFTHDGRGTSAAAWRTSPAWRDVAPTDGGQGDQGDQRGHGDHGLDDVNRLVVVAAHPDDETLGAGGLVAAAAARGLAIDLVVITDGEGSHPDSPTHPPDRLATVRRAESAAAAACLAPGLVPTPLGLPDGHVAEHEEAVVRRLVELIGDGRSTLVAAPWRHDGHPDHEAAGRAAATAAVRTGARLVEFPIWFWHWSDPTAAPWEQLVAHSLDPVAVDRKRAAIRAHASQVAPLSPAPGDEVLLTPGMLEHFTGDRELFVVAAPEDDALDDLHAGDADPWGVDSTWYEQRKRDLTLACLPRPRFERALEVGCSRGALAADLAPRCDALVAVDSSRRAAAAAAERLAGTPTTSHAEVEVMAVPEQWPGGTFDLVVVSEVGYFLSPAALDGLVARLRHSLRADGALVLCHWRHPVDGWVLDGPAVHQRLLEADLRPLLSRYRDDDVEVLVLGAPGIGPVPRA